MEQSVSKAISIAENLSDFMLLEYVEVQNMLMSSSL